MNKWLVQIKNLPPEQARMRQLVLLVSLIGFIATTILTVTSILERNVTEAIINGTSAILLAISLVTAWFGSIGFGRGFLPLTALISIAYLSSVGNGIHDPGILAFAIVIAIAALLLGGRGLIIYGTLSVAAILGIIFAGSTGILQHTRVSTPDIISTLMAIIVSTGILYLNSRQLEQSLDESRRSEQAQIQINQELREVKNSLEEQALELARTNEQSMRRAEQLHLVAEVANSTASIQELELLLTTVTELICQRIGIYHTSIFLLDESREYAILRAANSEGGQKMLSRGHHLKVGAQGIVGFVTATGNPRIVLNVSADSTYSLSPDLPNTQSEMALPLKIGSETIGALDLQSVETDAFSQEDVEVLTILADQVAIAIQNARSTDTTRRAIQDAEAASHELTGQTWSRFQQSQQVHGYRFDGVETTSITDASTEKNKSALQISVRLRGQEIGKLKLNSLGPDRTWSQDEIAMAEAAAERAALALENARLLEDAQRRAFKERTISESTARVSAALDIEGILNATAEELERTLGGSEVIIQLEREE